MVATLVAPLGLVIGGLVVAAVGTLALAGYTAVKSDDDDRTRQAFTLLLVSVFVWTAAHGGRLLAGSLGAKLIWQGVLYVGVVATPLVWLGFTLLYTGRGRYVRVETIALGLAGPATTLTMLYTNPIHHFFYASVQLTHLNEGPILTTTAGPFWWVHFAVSYFLIGVGIVLLVEFALTSDSLYRFQSIAILCSVVFPIGANLVTVFGFPSDPVVDLTPLAFALSVLFLFGAVFYGQFLTLVPVAHDAVIRRLEDGILVVDEDGQIVSANPEATAILEGEAETRGLVGRELSTVEPTLAVASDQSATIDDPGVEGGFEAARVSDGDPEWFWVRTVDLSATTAKRGTVLTLTDITSKKEFERQLRKLQRTHQRLLVAEDEAQIVDIATDAAKAALDLPVTGVWKHDESEAVLRPLGMTDDAHELLGTQPVLDDTDLAWQSFEEGELTRYTEVGSHPSTHNPETPLESEIHVPIGDWGVMSFGSTTRTEFLNVDFDLVRLLATAVERAVARRQREQRIRRLHRETSALMRAKSAEEIARTAVGAVDDVLGLSLSGIHLLADDEQVLEATAVTDSVREAFDTIPTYSRDGGTEVDDIIWEVFRTDETLVIEDVDETDSPVAASPVRSVIVHSLDDHGVFITSSPEPNAFDRTDRALAELFTVTVTAALDRVDRERKLRERERELQRQNERLAEFTSVVSHDLRSPLNQANIYLDKVATEYDDAHIDGAVTATERAKGMVDDLLALARQGKTVEDPAQRPLAPTVNAAWQAVPTGEGSLTLEADLGIVAADHERFRQVFENLFRNAVEHGGDAVTVRVGRLADATGLYVADDGPGIPADTRADVFDHGYTTAESGTGFGLAIVERIVQAHGWEIEVLAADGGGTRFEITGPGDEGS